MSLSAQNLRRRNQIPNKTIESKIGTRQREILYQHDYFTFFYVGISLIVSFFDYGGILISFLYFLDLLFLERPSLSKTQMKKTYQLNLLCTGLLGLASSITQLQYTFQWHMMTCIVPVLYIIHRRNKQNVILELIWVLGWLLLKIGLSWIVTFQYMNVSGEIYSKWTISTDKSPLINPWTNPPVILLTLISITNSVINLIQSYYVIIHNNKLI